MFKTVSGAVTENAELEEKKRYYTDPFIHGIWVAYTDLYYSML